MILHNFEWIFEVLNCVKPFRFLCASIQRDLLIVCLPSLSLLFVAESCILSGYSKQPLGSDGVQ